MQFQDGLVTISTLKSKIILDVNNQTPNRDFSQTDFVIVQKGIEFFKIRDTLYTIPFEGVNLRGERVSISENELRNVSNFEFKNGVVILNDPTGIKMENLNPLSDRKAWLENNARQKRFAQNLEYLLQNPSEHQEILQETKNQFLFYIGNEADEFLLAKFKANPAFENFASLSMDYSRRVQTKITMLNERYKSETTTRIGENMNTMQDVQRVEAAIQKEILQSWGYRQNWAGEATDKFFERLEVIKYVSTIKWIDKFGFANKDALFQHFSEESGLEINDSNFISFIQSGNQSEIISNYLSERHRKHWTSEQIVADLKVVKFSFLTLRTIWAENPSITPQELFNSMKESNVPLWAVSQMEKHIGKDLLELQKLSEKYGHLVDVMADYKDLLLEEKMALPRSLQVSDLEKRYQQRVEEILNTKRKIKSYFSNATSDFPISANEFQNNDRDIHRLQTLRKIHNLLGKNAFPSFLKDERVQDAYITVMDSASLNRQDKIRDALLAGLKKRGEIAELVWGEDNRRAKILKELDQLWGEDGYSLPLGHIKTSVLTEILSGQKTLRAYSEKKKIYGVDILTRIRNIDGSKDEVAEIQKEIHRQSLLRALGLREGTLDDLLRMKHKLRKEKHMMNHIQRKFKFVVLGDSREAIWENLKARTQKEFVHTNFSFPADLTSDFKESINEFKRSFQSAKRLEEKAKSLKERYPQFSDELQNARSYKDIKANLKMLLEEKSLLQFPEELRYYHWESKMSFILFYF